MKKSDENQSTPKTPEEIHAETLQWLESLPATDDKWLDSCPEAKAAFERGLDQAAQGRTIYRGSFSQYADLDLEEE